MKYMQEEEQFQQRESNVTDMSREDITGMTPISKHLVRESDKRFLISAKWWHAWCNYTGFNEAQLFDATYDTLGNEEDEAPSDYNKPGPICNEVLLKNESSAKSSCGHSG